MIGPLDAISWRCRAWWSRWRGMKYRRVLGVLVLFLVLVWGWAYWLWRSEPAYWQRRRSFVQTHTARQRMAVGESVEQRILAALSDVSVAAAGHRAGSQDSLFLSVDEINAWIDQRLYGWAANQGLDISESVEDPMLAIVDANLVIAFLYDTPQRRQIYSFQCEVLIQGDQAVIQVIAVSGGRLRIPVVNTVTRVMGWLRGQGSDIAQVAGNLDKAFEGMAFDPILNVGQQKVLLKAFEWEPDGARLVFEPYRQPMYAKDN